MRDVLPPEAARQSLVGRHVLRCFELHGFSRVWLPLFEYASLLERGHTDGGTLRFVEPESGEVVALRSDMTPQIARVISTRYQSFLFPVRLCYQGSVLRRRRERSRNASQVVQAGIELVGLGAAEGDIEVIEVACAAIRAAGLQSFALDIGHAAIPAALLSEAPAVARAGLVDALAAKDAVVLERRAKRSGLTGKPLRALVGLSELHGGAEVWEAADELLAETEAAKPMHELKALWLAVTQAELAPTVSVDLGETHRFDYYTGAMFQILAHGPGEPLASGGRYDNLYSSFGQQRQAAGFALDVNNVCWALDHARAPAETQQSLVADAGVSRELLTELRARNVACTQASDDPRSYALAWGKGSVLWSEPTLRLEVFGHAGPSKVDGLRVTEVAAQADQIIELLRRAGTSE